MDPTQDGLDNYKNIIICSGIISSIKNQEERQKQAIWREREINIALKEGSHVCILCNDTDDLLFKQVLSSNSIQFIQSISHISQMEIHRPEFSTFLNKYGTSFGIFSGNESFDSVICTSSKVYVSALLLQEDIMTYKNRYILGFTLKKGSGLITLLPFFMSTARYNYEKKSDEVLSKLIDSLDTHRKNIVSEQPSWTNNVKNKLEADLEDEISRIQNVMLEPKLKLLETQYYLKSILWKKHDELRDACIKVFEELGIKTMKNDVGIEDFYLQSNSNSNICICETKGKDNDLVMGDLIKFEANRNRAGKNEYFPSLLIANTHNKANTFEEKDRPIPSNVIDKAVRNNILLMRSLDLYRLIDMYQKREVDTNIVLNKILGSKGWFQVKEDIKVKTK